MATPTLLILGGYGATGLLTADLLLQQTEARLVLAGRHVARAASAAADFNRIYPGERVSATAADAADPASLRQAMAGVDLVVVASSTSQYTRQVAEAALAERIDYLDIQVSAAKLAVLRSLASEIAAAGCCFITDGGFHPGLPAALVRLAAASFDRLTAARVGSVIQIDWRSLEPSQDTIDELIRELADFQTLVYRDGAWQRLGWLASFKPDRMEFSHGFGRQSCVPMFLEELRPLPDLIPSLRDTGFLVGGFNPVVDWVILPVGMVAARLWPQAALRPMGRWLLWGLRRFARPPFGTLLKLEASGEKAGRPQRMDVTVYHRDGYFLTAAPVVACLKQVLDGSARRSGLWFQALLAEPGRLLRDMQAMGVEIDIVARPG